MFIPFKFLKISKSILLVILLIIPLLTFGQSSIKVNATTLIGIPNIGFETALGENFTFQVDVSATFGTTEGIPFKLTNSITSMVVNWFDPSRQKAASEFPYGGPYKLGILIPELRYYTKESGKGFYVGAHIGGGIYKLQKWNHPKEYHEGYTVLFGATIGYQFIINDRFNLELFLGGGNQQANYKAYSLITGERTDGASNYNKSSESLPYRGGLMLVYKFKKKENNIQE